MNYHTNISTKLLLTSVFTKNVKAFVHTITNIELSSLAKFESKHFVINFSSKTLHYLSVRLLLYCKKNYISKMWTLTFSIFIWCFLNLSKSVGIATLMNFWIAGSIRRSLTFSSSSDILKAAFKSTVVQYTFTKVKTPKTKKKLNKKVKPESLFKEIKIR